MGFLKTALKSASYIHLGGGQGWNTPASQSIVYSSPWADEAVSVIGRSVTDKTALTFVPFYAGVRLIAESVGRLPLVLYRRTGDDDRERARDKQLYGMLHDEPNPAMSAMVFKETLTGHIVCRGNGYAERVRDDLGRDKELWPLRPDRMQVLLDTETGKKFYRYRIESLGDEVDLTADQVFHVPGFGYDGRVGYSVVSLFRDSIALGLAAQEFGARFFKSGAQPAAVVTHPKGWSKATVSEFASSLRGATSGLSNAQRIAVIEEGITWHTVGMNLDDAQFLETRKFQRSEVPTMLNIPPHMLQDVERTTSWGTGIEEQTLGFVTFSLGAWLERWSQESNRQLVRPAYGNDLYAEFLVEALLQGRAEDRGKFYQILWGMGVLNGNDIAKKENLPAPTDDSGTTYYIPSNYMPARAEQFSAQRVEAYGALIRAGVDPASAAATVGLPPMEHTGLEPVTVSEQGEFSGSGNGNGKGHRIRVLDASGRETASIVRG